MAKPEQPIKLVSQRDLRALLQQCDGYQKKMDTANGHLRELISDYKTKKNLHPGAFRMIRRWSRMEPGELWLELAHLDDYRAKAGIDRRATQQGQLLAAGTEDEEDENTNVTKMRRRNITREEEASPPDAAE